MKDLFRSEWRRFRLITAIVTVCHALVLATMSRVVDIPHLNHDEHGAMLFVYMLLGLTLALLQVGSYRQTSRWLWLIHRPLPPVRIFAALALSALAMLSAAIFAPLLVYLIATDVFTSHVVDIRHYITILHTLAFAIMAWLAGAHASTSRHKAAIAVLFLPLLFAWHVASVWWLVLPVLGCVAWLALIARHSFRADRDARIARRHVLLLTALPLQLAFFLIAFHLSKGGSELFEVLTRRPGRTVVSTDPNAEVDAALRGFTQKFMAKGLAHSRDSRAGTWREQLPLLTTATVTPDIERFPVRHQFSNVAQPWWDDIRNIKYNFSHDRMKFHGRDPRTGESRGWWGVSGANASQPFTDMPAFNMTRSILYATDKEAQRQHELLRLREGERFVGRPVEGLDRVLVLTNQRVLAYQRDRAALSAFAPPKLDWQLPIAEGEFAPVVDIAEMLDGWLVSLFYFDTREFSGFESFVEPWQQVVYVDADGAATVVGERRNIRDHNATFGAAETVPVASWWISPVLYAFAHVPDLMDTGLTQPPRLHLLPRVPIFYSLALALIVISLVAAYAWLRRSQVDASRRRFWLASCALIGIPAFLSMICLEPRGVAAR
jgi:hypothetical protein